MSAPAQTASAWDLAQAECVSWFNGKNVDVRPDPDPNFYGGAGEDNAFFSDEDELSSGPDAGPGIGGGDESYQDYDPDRVLDRCVPQVEQGPRGLGRSTDFAIVAGFVGEKLPEPIPAEDPITHRAPNYAAVVEKGDCDPIDGIDFRYRGHLDFVDPNDIYHEVQEYDYVCGDPLQTGGPGGNLVPGGIASAALAAEVKSRFPWTGTFADEVDGCAHYEGPAENGTFDWGHKCNGSVQDLFTERIWITPVHDIIIDPTLHSEYNFAIAIDTCSGLNVHEHGFFGDLEPHDVDATDYFLDANGLGRPMAEVCHDGSSFSFDDTPRGRILHDSPPAGTEEIKRGSAYDNDANSTTFLKHRENCRSNYVDWSYNDYPGPNRAPSGPAGLFEESGLGQRAPRYTMGDECYPEDHKSAQIDIYWFDEDPTGQFLRYANNMTGLNTYVTGESTGPGWLPPGWGQ